MASAVEDRGASGAGGGTFYERHRWVVFVLPFVVFMAVGAFEPIPPKPKPKSPEELAASLQGAQPAPAEKPAPGDPAAEKPAPGDSGAEKPAPGDPGMEKPAPGDAPAEKPAPSDSAAEPAALAPAGPPAEQPAAEEYPTANWAGIPFTYYPLVYAIKIGLTVLAMLLVLPGYRWFPCRVSPWAILAGVGGVILWVGMCELQLEAKWLEPLGLGSFLELGTRSGFNPFRAFHDRPEWMLWGFIALRLFGFVLIVAIVEEFFLRGFLMRFVMRADWWEAPVGSASVSAVVACVIYAVLSHPEVFAAAAWFLFITLLAVKTKNIWDCVAAHAITNLLLALYVLVLQEWKYW